MSKDKKTYNHSNSKKKTQKKKTKQKKTKQNKTQKKKENPTPQWTKGNIDSFVLSNKKLDQVLKKIKHLQKYDILEKWNLYLPPSDQQRTGRCWLFAYLNKLRLKSIYHMKLPQTFAFSASYMLFWDKYEKCKYFLQKISKYAQLPLDDVNNHLLLRNMISDGGTWHMIQNLVEKYGVVPYDSMKESFHTMNTTQLHHYLNDFLKTSSQKIRELPNTQHKSYIEKQMKKVYILLVKAIGTPPKKVSFLQKGQKYSPQSFFKTQISTLSGCSIKNKVVLIHVPHLKTNQYYTVPELNNMQNGYPLLYFNTTMDVIKKSVLYELSKDNPVWFGCDFGPFYHKEEALLNNNIFDYSHFTMKKKDLFLEKKHSISYYQTNVNHAMLIRGYYHNKTNTKPLYWIIENSHNTILKNVSFENSHGTVTLSDSWFDKYVVLVVVEKKSIENKTIQEKLKNTSYVIELPKWSNLGELL
jgi:bleomycin hydrolase